MQLDLSIGENKIALAEEKIVDSAIEYFRFRYGESMERAGAIESPKLKALFDSVEKLLRYQTLVEFDDKGFQ